METVLPPVVSFLSQQRKAIGNALGKAVRSAAENPTASQTVAWSEFQHLLQVGQGERESGLPLDDDFWSSARALADPHNTGEVEYRPLLNRCHFRFVQRLSSFLIQKHPAFAHVFLVTCRLSVRSVGLLTTACVVTVVCGSERTWHEQVTAEKLGEWPERSCPEQAP